MGRESDTGLDSRPGLHEAFLARAANDQGRDAGSSGLGAFLTLRLVDQFAAESLDVSPEATAYQITATRDFLSDLYPRTPEVASLQEIVRVAGIAHETQSPRLLFAPLLALAYQMEQRFRYPEALDVLSTALRLSETGEGREEAEARLQQGRVLRLSGELKEAKAAYKLAGEIAARLGDRHSEFLSRVGRGIVLRLLGNLPESEKQLRAVIVDARKEGDRDAEARACQDLAGTLFFAGRSAEAIPLAFRAFELYDRPLSRARALSDTGSMLKELGHYAAARQAFAIVLAGDLPPEVRACTVLELLELSALAEDRLSFERWRQELSGLRDVLPTELQVDYEIKMGVGLSLFGRAALGEAHLKRGMSLAEQCGMGERIFHAEHLLNEFRERRTRSEEAHATFPVGEQPSIQETLERLESLALAETA